MTYSTETTKRVTHWGKSDSPMLTTRGLTTYGQWCEQEAKRISRGSKRAVVKQNGSLVCVAWE